MSDTTQRRVNAALHRVVNDWLPPAPAEGDLARAKHVRRRRTIEEFHPDLVRALDELVLAVTADTAAKIEALQKDAAPTLAAVNQPHLAAVPLGALSEVDPEPCPTSGLRVHKPDQVNADGKPSAAVLLYGTVVCHECGLTTPVRRMRRSGAPWRYITHTPPTTESE